MALPTIPTESVACHRLLLKLLDYITRKTENTDKNTIETNFIRKDTQHHVNRDPIILVKTHMPREYFCRAKPIQSICSDMETTEGRFDGKVVVYVV